MNKNPIRIAKYFMAAVFLAGSFLIAVSAQPAEEPFGKEVQFQNVGGHRSYPVTCSEVDTMVYNEESLKKLRSLGQCAEMFKVADVDLKKETLIGWQAGGDCHMRVEVKLYRNDEKKLFTLVVNNIWGGCRAGGWRHGLFSIDKIPADYKVKFIEYLVERNFSGEVREKDNSATWTANGQQVVAEKPAPSETPEPRMMSAAEAKASGNPTLETASDNPKDKNVPVIKPAASQLSDETEVKILRSAGSRYYKCHPDTGGIYTEEEYQALLANKECKAAQELKADLKKESVIGFGASGDCHVSGRAKVFRSDKTKSYTIEVNTIYGGCRAYGQYRGWIVIEKMRPDYQVKWTHLRTDEGGRVEVDDRFPPQPQVLETSEIDMKGCIRLDRSRDLAIKDDASLLAAIRQDASNDFCRQELKKIDFGKYTLFGTHIVSDYCDRPADLTHKLVRDDVKKTDTFQVNYSAPQGLCRRIGQYDLWVLAPKTPAGYETAFDIQSPDRKRN